MSNNLTENFIYIVGVLMTKERLTRLDGLQYKSNIICWLHNQGAIYPVAVRAKISDIAQYLNMGVRTFKRHSQELYDLGFIGKVSSSQHVPNAYCLHPNSLNSFQAWLIYECDASYHIHQFGDEIYYSLSDILPIEHDEK